MKIRRERKLLVEPPATATGDIAFNLIVFFLVCASVQPESGRKQDIPKSEPEKDKTQQSKNIEVQLTRTTAAINGTPVRLENFKARLGSLLKGKTRPQDKIVVVKSKPDTSYLHWIKVTGWIEEVGGVITLQLEEERTVMTPG